MSATEWITRIPGDAGVLRLEDGERLGRERRILEPGVGEARDDPLVESGVGHGVDARAVVLALEVDRVDGARRCELRDQLVRPVGCRVELEAEARIVAEPGVEAFGRRRLAESHRDDERQRLGLPADGGTERQARLAQREVERSALVRPAPVVEVRVLVGLVIEELERLEVLRERVERPRLRRGRAPAPATRRDRARSPRR